MTEWSEQEFQEFSALIKKLREAFNELEHLMRLVRDQAESLESVQPRIQELFTLVSEANSKLQKFLKVDAPQ